MQESQREYPAVLLFRAQQHSVQFIKETLLHCSVLYSPPLKTEHVRHNTVFTGLELEQINLQESSTPVEGNTMSVRVRAECITSQRTLATMTWGPIIALWPSMGRYCLEREPNWMLKV